MFLFSLYFIHASSTWGKVTESTLATWNMYEITPCCAFETFSHFMVHSMAARVRPCEAKHPRPRVFTLFWQVHKSAILLISELYRALTYDWRIFVINWLRLWGLRLSGGGKTSLKILFIKLKFNVLLGFKDFIIKGKDIPLFIRSFFWNFQIKLEHFGKRNSRA